jgi:putative ABC transport system permease protein
MVYYSALLNTTSHPTEVVSAVEKVWMETWPEKPFDYFFLDNYYDRQYKSEIHFNRIFITFSVIAISIACLGILGMSLFEANARLKEISIRKVLGASIGNLLILLTKKYFVLISVAGLIAIPLIYLASSEWLKTYPVHVDVSCVTFLIPLMIITLVVIITSVFQTVKAAQSNPVDHLKYE